MTRRWYFLLLLTLAFIICTFPAQAAKPVTVSVTIGAPPAQPEQPVQPPVDAYALDIYSQGFGLKEVLSSGEPGWQLTFNEVGLSSRDVELQAGAEYRIPAHFFLWQFYGGGRLHYRAIDNSVVPYVLGGSEFLHIFFAEQGFTLEEYSQTFARAGIRIRF